MYCPNCGEWIEFRTCQKCGYCVSCNEKKIKIKKDLPRRVSQ